MFNRTINIVISTSNAAFADSQDELPRILHKLATDIESMSTGDHSLRDANGNKVGSVSIND